MAVQGTIPAAILARLTYEERMDLILAMRQLNGEADAGDAGREVMLNRCADHYCRQSGEVYSVIIDTAPNVAGTQAMIGVMMCERHRDMLMHWAMNHGLEVTYTGPDRRHPCIRFAGECNTPLTAQGLANSIRAAVPVWLDLLCEFTPDERTGIMRACRQLNGERGADPFTPNVEELTADLRQAIADSLKRGDFGAVATLTNSLTQLVSAWPLMPQPAPKARA